MSGDTIAIRQLAPATRHPGLVPARVVVRGALRGALVWGTVFGAFIWVLISQYGKEYPTAADRANLVETMGSNLGLQAIFGIAHRLDTIGGYVAYHTTALLGLIGAIWGLLAATRLLRGNEEAGRWELVLAGQTTRRRATAGALAGLGTGLFVLWGVTAAVTVFAGRGESAGFPVTGCLFLAVTATASAAMFAAVGAVCSQLAATRRQAAAIAAGAFGVAYLIRLVSYSDTSLLWLHWASPLGWADELRPLTGSRPLALLPITAFIVILAAAAILLAGRRDLGAGVLPASDSATARTQMLTGPLGLAARLAARGACGWIVGLAGGGFILGLVAKAAEDVAANRVGGVVAKLGGAAGGSSYLGVAFLVITLAVTMAAAGQVAAIRDEEAAGHLDHLLARPIARSSWLMAKLAVSAIMLVAAGISVGLATWAGAAISGASQDFATLLAAGVNVIPVGVFILGAGTIVHGLAPRFAVTAAYAIVVWSFLIEIVGASMDTSRWLLDLSVLHHLARAPAVPVNWGSAAILTAIGIAAAAAGMAAFARRDLAGA